MKSGPETILCFYPYQDWSDCIDDELNIIFVNYNRNFAFEGL
jgi:hypothetical protein